MYSFFVSPASGALQTAVFQTCVQKISCTRRYTNRSNSRYDSNLLFNQKMHVSTGFDGNIRFPSYLYESYHQISIIQEMYILFMGEVTDTDGSSLPICKQACAKIYIVACNHEHPRCHHHEYLASIILVYTHQLEHMTCVSLINS